MIRRAVGYLYFIPSKNPYEMSASPGEVLTPDSRCQAPMVPRSCSAILVSFLWGAIGPAEVAAPLGNVTATVGAVLLLVAGARGGDGKSRRIQ